MMSEEKIDNIGLSSFKKRKILNDPVYGFVTIPSEFLFNIVEHPYFQRLRRIKQLGLTHLVYPGASGRMPGVRAKRASAR